MIESQIHVMARHLAASRRSLLGGVLAPAGAWLGSATVGARKKRKRKRKRTSQLVGRPNAFGCLDVDDPCQREDQCCSGICEGKKGQRTCRAHDTGSCSAGEQFEICGGTEDVSCTTSAGTPGLCGTTTGNAGYCLASAHCFACQTDADCQEALDGLFGPRAACIPCAVCAKEGGTICGTAFIPPM
jgi:hypothetical protein